MNPEENIETPKGARKIEIPVGGMTCAACVRRVENALRSLDGVVSANVNFATERASVEYIPSKVSLADLKRRCGPCFRGL